MERVSTTTSIEELKSKAKNANTTKSTSQWMRVYISWAKLRNKELEIERLAPDVLDDILQGISIPFKTVDTLPGLGQC